MFMKNTILIFFFILTIFSSYGQNTFELLISNPVDEQPRDGVQLDNGDFIFPLAARDDYYSNYYTRIIKISSSGQVVNEIQIDNHNALIYPNPGNDLLIVESGSQISGYEFILSDINGKTLIHHRIDQQRMQFVTSNLPAGLYAWRIIGNQKIIDSGRWIITR